MVTFGPHVFGVAQSDHGAKKPIRSGAPSLLCRYSGQGRFAAFRRAHCAFFVQHEEHPNGWLV